MTLLGPTDASNYRVKVGRYGDRWYTDPLPACPIAPASDWTGPSVSTTKPPFSNKYVPMRSIADMASEEWARLATKSADERYEAIKAHDKLASRVNMDRGSVVHSWAEDRLLGRSPLLVEPSRWADGALEQAEKFRPALDAFFDAYQPELVACEVPCLHRDLNGVGYGGTADALVKIEGDVWAIDWKSRHSDHAAYLEEAAQGGAYIGAQYMIVRGDNGDPVRAPIPDVAGVLIVSIRTDGYRAYPIDRDGAIEAYAEMHRWWVAQRRVVDNGVIGKPWGPKVAPAPVADDRRQRLRDRYALLSDEEKIAFQEISPDPDDLDAVEAALAQVDGFNVRVEPPAPPPAPVVVEQPALTETPDEGNPADEEAFRLLQARFQGLAQAGSAWVSVIARQAEAAGVSFRAAFNHSVRRFEIYRGLVLLAEHGHDDDELVRELVATVLGSDAPFFPTIPVGHAVGAMGADEASRFARLCDDLCVDVTAVDLRQRPAA